MGERKEEEEEKGSSSSSSLTWILVGESASFVCVFFPLAALAMHGGRKEGRKEGERRMNHNSAWGGRALLSRTPVWILKQNFLACKQGTLFAVSFCFQSVSCRETLLKSATTRPREKKSHFRV